MPGVKVFLQYVNGKGQVSPIYYTTSDSEGKFVFDLSKAPKDGLGNPVEFKLAGDSKFQVRTWAENPDPAKYTLAAGGDMYSGRFHDRLTRKWESWDFTAGINRIVGSKVVFQERPNLDGWLAKPKLSGPRHRLLIRSGQTVVIMVPHGAKFGGKTMRPGHTFQPIL